MKRIHEEDLNTPEYYAKIWAQPGLHHYDATRLRSLARKIKPGQRLLDLGAGCFGTGQYYAEDGLVPGLEIVSLDFCPFAKKFVDDRIDRVILKKYKSFDYIIGDVCHAPFPDSSFDLVTAGELIEHMQSPEGLVREMARLSRHWVTISTVDTNCEAARKLEYPEHLWEFTPEDLLALFGKYGKAEYYLFGDYHVIELEVQK